MAKLYNLARVQTATAGTGTVTLGSAVSGYLTFALAGVQNAELVSYGIKDGTASEVGFGVYTSSGTTLSRFVRKSTNSDALLNLSGAAEVFITSLASDIVLPKGYLYGLTLSNNVTDATNDIDIATGEAVDSTGIMNMVLASAITKRLDAAWAVGSGNGGRMSAAAITDTTYHMWLIMRPDTGVVDVGFDVSATAPTLPTNYTVARRIGSVIRASSTILSFTQWGDEFLLNSQIYDINMSATLGTSASLVAMNVPLGIKVDCLLGVQFNNSGTASVYFKISSPDQTDVAPTSSLYNVFTNIAGQFSSWQGSIRTNTSGQIRLRASAASSSAFGQGRGWIDRRDRT